MNNRRLFWGLFIINFSITLGFGLADAFFSVYVMSLGARGLLLGLPLALYALSKILFSPFMGACSDKIGRKHFAVLSLSLYLLVSVSYTLTLSLIVITMLRFLQGVGCAMFRPVLISLISECACEKKRATVMGRFDMSFYGALSLGPVLGGVLKDVFGFAGIFITLSALCVVALTVALICIPSRPDKPLREDEQKSSSSFPAAAVMSRRYSTLRGLLAFIFGRACGIAILGAFLPILLTVKLGLSGMQTGLVMASSSIIMTALLCPIGRLSDKIPRRSLVLSGGVVVPLLYFLIPATAGFWQVLLLCGAIGFFSVLSQPASSALLLEEGNRHGMGVTVGIFNAVLNMGFAAGSLVGAVIQKCVGLQSVFYLAGALGLVSVLVFFFSLPPVLFYNKAPFAGKQDHKLTGIFNASYHEPVTDNKNYYRNI